MLFAFGAGWRKKTRTNTRLILVLLLHPPTPPLKGAPRGGVEASYFSN